MARIAITGASRGIGLEMARQAAARGDEVIAFARASERSEALLELCAAAAVTALPMDVTDPASCARAAEAARAAAPIDLLVCNAGVFVGRGGIDDPDHTREGWEATLMTNVAGPFFTVRAMLPLMRRPGGRIAVISSRMGSNVESTGGGAYAYRASKAAATNLAGNLARDLAAEGIAVGAYHPGWVRTDMGGGGADVSADDSAAGLLARFDALTAERSGVFEDYLGTPIVF